MCTKNNCIQSTHNINVYFKAIAQHDHFFINAMIKQVTIKYRIQEIKLFSSHWINLLYESDL